MLETIMPKVRLFPPARLRACRFGWYLSSSMAFTTRARVEVLTTLALFNTRETVAVDTFARRATCSRFISNIVQANPKTGIRFERGAPRGSVLLFPFGVHLCTHPLPVLLVLRL